MLVLSLVAFFILAQTPLIRSVIDQLGSFGYIGAFITGIFFVSTFTAVPATVILFTLANNLHPLEVALLAGAGAMVGDFIIFRFMKDTLFEELGPLFRRLNRPKFSALFKTPYFAWLMPVIGAAIIASPLPDEIGVSMLGLSKIKKWQFFLVTYILNAAGIFLIVTAARL